MDHEPVGDRIRIVRHDSPLGRWSEVVCRPAAALAAHVEMIWYGEGTTRYQRDRILPRGVPFLLVNLGPPQLLVDPWGGPPRLFDEIWFSGQQDTYLETEAPGGVAMMGVAFSPFGAYAVSHSTQDPLRNQVVELAALLGDGVRALRQRLLEAPLRRRFALLEGWLLERIGEGRATHPLTRWAVQRLAADAGQTRIGELAREAGYTRKHLTALFQREIGLPPKALARIYRFHHALAMLRRGGSLGWAEVALRCGYYDQSHLIRDLRSFTGLAASELLARPAADELTLVVE